MPNNVHAGCSKTHLPGYVNDYQKLKDAGAEVIVVTAGKKMLANLFSQQSVMQTELVDKIH